MYFCTLFDSNYMSRGLIMYQSLMKVSPNSVLYIFAFDELSLQVLIDLNLKNVIVISLNEFEDESLLKVKNSRSKGEYCWTCTPSIIKYCLEKFQIEQCTYIDADLYFYSNPIVLLDEMQDKSILITDHRYTKKYDQFLTSGKYCVQFISIKNDVFGLEALSWWRERCLEWCYNRSEDGKFGDQKYLDDWPVRFKNVHELLHLGGGVAPWNMQQYDFFTSDSKIYLKEKSSGNVCPLVFFHFHALKISRNYFDLGFYRLPNNCKNVVYDVYLSAIEEIDSQLLKSCFDFNWHAIAEEKLTARLFFRKIKRVLLGIYNIYPTKRNLHGSSN